MTEVENSMKRNVSTLKKKILDLQIAVRVLNMKNKLLRQIIQTSTDIDVDSIFDDKEDGIHIYNYKDGSIPVFVHDIIDGDEKEYNLMKKNYRSLPKSGLVEERVRGHEEKIRLVDKTFDQIYTQKFDIPLNETMTLIDSLFKDLEGSRTYKGKLEEIKDKRSRLLGRIDLDKYTEMLNNHIELLTVLFKKTKSFTDSKTVEAISLSLTPLDMRLSFYGQYYNTSHNPDDLERFRQAMEIKTPYPKMYTPLSKDETFSRFFNYSMIVYPLLKNMERILINPYGFPSIAYIPKTVIKASAKNVEPYTFYTLTEIKQDGIRGWNLDYQLYHFCDEFVTVVRPYCTKTFRRIYFDVFKDNKYREDYSKAVPILDEEGLQIIKSIYLMTKRKEFRSSVQKLIIEKATIKPTRLDKINMASIDQLIKRAIDAEKGDERDLFEAAQNLFDGITPEQSDILWDKCLEKVSSESSDESG